MFNSKMRKIGLTSHGALTMALLAGVGTDPSMAQTASSAAAPAT